MEHASFLLGKPKNPVLRNRMHIIANWKMNGDDAAIEAWLRIMQPSLVGLPPAITAVLCPPAPLLASAAQKSGNALALGGQDCSPHASGAHTGDISAPMLHKAGATYVIVGHSERRTHHGETSELVAKKAAAAAAAGLIPIICIGETLAEREAGSTIAVITAQLKASMPGGLAHAIIAYEPVWAIGTGHVPEASDIIAAHAAIAKAARDYQLTGDRAPCVVYGGSVNPTNAASILALEGVDGALVGGASLDAGQYAAIVAAASVCCQTSA